MNSSIFESRLLPLLFAVLLLSACMRAPVVGQVGPYDSGGPLMVEQAAYDVTYYDLALDVNPADSTIEGSVTVHARAGSPLEWFVLDLVPELEVRRISTVASGTEKTMHFERREGKLWIRLPHTYQSGEMIEVTVAYGGTPHVAVRAPWDGGFTWARTPSESPWVATSCQGEGADIWWPVKDHVSDEPDSMDIRVTVPDPLVVASNGRLVETSPTADGRTTFHWHVSTPINTYTVALNIAPYRIIKDKFLSVAGDTFPVLFYVLPEDYDKGLKFMDEIKAHLRFYEERLGPYPFRIDKYGVAQTPHLGMEHQSIIAYGANFSNVAMTPRIDFGFDKLHHHELSHEWWGNLVTNADWKDLWIHEGFGTYMQALYAEELNGENGYLHYLSSIRPMIGNRSAVAPYESATVDEMGDRDVYFKGGWILHTLRYLIGDEAMNASLRRMAYPTPEMEAVTDGRQCRFASTDDFIRIVEEISERDLSWFFDLYVRQPELPELVVERDGPRLRLEWKTPNDMPFPMPVEVSFSGDTIAVDMTAGWAELQVPDTVFAGADPRLQILKKEVSRD
jgi:aminopeptidase N